jgi:hypothetical protein
MVRGKLTVAGGIVIENDWLKVWLTGEPLIVRHVVGGTVGVCAGAVRKIVSPMSAFGAFCRRIPSCVNGGGGVKNAGKGEGGGVGTGGEVEKLENASIRFTVRFPWIMLPF